MEWRAIRRARKLFNTCMLMITRLSHLSYVHAHICLGGVISLWILFRWMLNPFRDSKDIDYAQESPCNRVSSQESQLARESVRFSFFTD